MSRGFGDGTGRGFTFPHLPDKNLPTTFRLSDIKDETTRIHFKRLQTINARVPQRENGAWVFYRRAKELRHLLERVYPCSDVQRQSEDKIGKILEFAARLTVDRPLPQSVPYLREAFAYLCIVHSDRHILLPFRVGRKALIAKLVGASDDVEQDSISTSPALPTNFALRTRNGGGCAWEMSLRFESMKGLKPASEDVELRASLTMPEGSVNVAVPLTICYNVIGHRSAVGSHARLPDQASMVFLSASKRNCMLGEPVKIAVWIKPALKGGRIIQGRLQLKTGRKASVILEGYKQLCQHYSLPVTTTSAREIVANDPTLREDERRKAAALADAIHTTFKNAVAIQELKPEIAAAIAVVDIAHRSAISVAERYDVDISTLRNRLGLWHALNPCRWNYSRIVGEMGSKDGQEANQ
jgi:hypothetical protein